MTKKTIVSALLAICILGGLSACVKTDERPNKLTLDVDRISISYEITDDEKNDVDITETETILEIISLCEPAKLENTSKPMGFPRFNINFYYNGEIVADFHIDNNEVISGNRLGVGNYVLPDNSVFNDLQEIFNNSK